MNFLLKTLLKSKLKGVPESEIDKIITLVEKNPALFKQIAEEIQSKTKNGMSEQDAAVIVMKEHEQELRGLTS